MNRLFGRLALPLVSLGLCAQAAFASVLNPTPVQERVMKLAVQAMESYCYDTIWSGPSADFPLKKLDVEGKHLWHAGPGLLLTFLSNDEGHQVCQIYPSVSADAQTLEILSDNFQKWIEDRGEALELKPAHFCAESRSYQIADVQSKSEKDKYVRFVFSPLPELNHFMLAVAEVGETPLRCVDGRWENE